MSDFEIWVGLLHVAPRPGNDLIGDALGSFVSVVAIADDAEGFASIATQLLEAMDFDVIEIEDVEPWEARIQNSSPEQELRELVETLTVENFAAYSTFYSYDSEEE